MTMKAKWMAIALAIAGAFALPADAQVVRENGAKSIAGVLYTLPSPQVASAEWTFLTSGPMVLFADLDAEIYRNKTGHDHLTVPDAVTGAACTDGEDDGGLGLFRLLVIDPNGNVVCTAERPAPPPGWQRDPRMACYLPPLTTRQTPTYRLRVEMKAPEGELGQPYYPFLLNVSLRRIASTGTDISTAFTQSGF